MDEHTGTIFDLLESCIFSDGRTREKVELATEMMEELGSWPNDLLLPIRGVVEFPDLTVRLLSVCNHLSDYYRSDYESMVCRCIEYKSNEIPEEHDWHHRSLEVLLNRKNIPKGLKYIRLLPGKYRIHGDLYKKTIEAGLSDPCYEGKEGYQYDSILETKSYFGYRAVYHLLLYGRDKTDDLIAKWEIEKDCTYEAAIDFYRTNGRLPTDRLKVYLNRSHNMVNNGL